MEGRTNQNGRRRRDDQPAFILVRQLPLITAVCAGALAFGSTRAKTDANERENELQNERIAALQQTVIQDYKAINEALNAIAGDIGTLQGRLESRQ